MKTEPLFLEGRGHKGSKAETPDFPKPTPGKVSQRLAALNQRVERLIGLAQRPQAPAHALNPVHRQQLADLEGKVNLLESLLAARAGSGPEALAARARSRTTRTAPADHGGGGGIGALSVTEPFFEATPGEFFDFILPDSGTVEVSIRDADGGAGSTFSGSENPGGAGGYEPVTSVTT